MCSSDLALDTDELQPARLRHLLRTWRTNPQEMYGTRAIVAFAALGQGRADGKLTPEEESAVITKLLTYWALQSTLFVTAGCPDCGLPMSSVPHVHNDHINALKGPGYARTEHPH